MQDSKTRRCSRSSAKNFRSIKRRGRTKTSSRPVPTARLCLFHNAAMQIFGHRGAPGFPRRCENTLGSFRRALEAGADGFELDVRWCGDGQLVVIHDATVDRTTNGTGRVSTMAYTELRGLDAGGGEP